MTCSVYQSLPEIHTRLSEIGVPIEPLLAAVEAGATERSLCTENDPPFIPGTEAWRFVVRTLREHLLPLGWRKSDPANYSLVINDLRRISIVVASADGMTGRTHGMPRTKSVKGLYTEAAIARNQYKDDLFPETLEDKVRLAASVLEYPVWVLLIYITDDEVRAELSLPSEIEKSKIVDWQERIILPVDRDGLEALEDYDDTPTVVDFDVPRKK